MVKDALEDLGCDVLGPVATIADGYEMSQTTDADACILNLVLQGEISYSIAEVLLERQIPFGFASGAEFSHALPEWESYPFLAKPYSADDLYAFLTRLLPDGALVPQRKNSLEL